MPRHGRAMRRGVSYGANIRNKSVLYAMLYVLLAPWPPIVACPLMRKAGPGNHPSPPPRPAALAGGGARGGRPCCTKKESPQIVANSLGCCDSDGIQTRNLLIRSQMLYSVELRSQAFAIVLFLNCGAKVGSFFHTTKLFANFLRKKCEKGVFRRPSGCRARLARAKCAERLLALGRLFGLKSRHFFCRLGILGYLCIMQAALGKQEASFLSSRLHCL